MENYTKSPLLQNSHDRFPPSSSAGEVVAPPRLQTSGSSSDSSSSSSVDPLYRSDGLFGWCSLEECEPSDVIDPWGDGFAESQGMSAGSWCTTLGSAGESTSTCTSPDRFDDFSSDSMSEDEQQQPQLHKNKSPKVTVLSASALVYRAPGLESTPVSGATQATVDLSDHPPIMGSAPLEVCGHAITTPKATAPCNDISAAKEMKKGVVADNAKNPRRKPHCATCGWPKYGRHHIGGSRTHIGRRGLCTVDLELYKNPDEDHRSARDRGVTTGRKRGRPRNCDKPIDISRLVRERQQAELEGAGLRSEKLVCPPSRGAAFHIGDAESLRAIPKQCIFCLDSGTGADTQRRRLKESGKWQPSRMGLWLKQMGYEGPPYCQRCSQVFKEHLILHNRNPAKCTRRLPCDHCSRVLLKFDVRGQDLWLRIDSSRQAKLQRKAERQKANVITAAPSQTWAVEDGGFESENASGLDRRDVLTSFSRVPEWSSSQNAKPIDRSKRKSLALATGLVLVVCVVMAMVARDFDGKSSSDDGDAKSLMAPEVPEQMCGNWFNASVYVVAPRLPIPKTIADPKNPKSPDNPKFGSGAATWQDGDQLWLLEGFASNRMWRLQPDAVDSRVGDCNGVAYSAEPMSAPRWWNIWPQLTGAMAFTFRQQHYLFGGSDESSSTADLWRFTLEDDVSSSDSDGQPPISTVIWETLHTDRIIPDPSALGTEWIQQLNILLGTQDHAATELLWPLKRSRGAIAMSSDNTHGYLFGGIFNQDFPSRLSVPLADLWLIPERSPDSSNIIGFDWNYQGPSDFAYCGRPFGVPNLCEASEGSILWPSSRSGHAAWVDDVNARLVIFGGVGSGIMVDGKSLANIYSNLGVVVDGTQVHFKWAVGCTALTDMWIYNPEDSKFSQVVEITAPPRTPALGLNFGPVVGAVIGQLHSLLGCTAQ